MIDLYFYIILFLFLLNFILLIKLSNFIIKLAENMNKITDLDLYKQKNNKQDEKGLIDI